MTDSLPATFNATEIEDWLKNRISSSNLKSSMRVILRLITGLGIVHKAKGNETFYKGKALIPSDDLESIRKEAEMWLPYHKGPDCLDKGHGWALNHPIQKLVEFKQNYLLGIEEKVKEKGSKKRKMHDPTPLEKIYEIKSLMDNGIITPEEFDAKKAELLARI